MKHPRISCILLLWSSLLFAADFTSCTYAHAEDDQAHGNDAAARDAFAAGRTAYERGDFDSALEHYEHALALSKRPELLFNIGRAADSDGQARRALVAYEGYLSAVPAADNRSFVEARVARLRAAAGLNAVPSAAPPLPSVADAMPQAVSATPAPVASPAQPVDQGERSRAVWKRGWFWTAVGAVIVAGTVGTIVGVTRAGEPNRAKADEYVHVTGAR